MVKEDGAHLAYLLIYVTRVTDPATNLCYYRLRYSVSYYRINLQGLARAE